jgi:3-deoxy-7-phosphoheptulonate synthase
MSAQLATFPPLVFAGEARNLKKSLARVARGGLPATGRRLRRSAARRQQHHELLRVFLQMAVV